MNWNWTKKNTIKAIAASLVAVFVVALLNTFIVINPGQAGVYSILGKSQDDPFLEGLHLKYPFASVVDVFDLTVQKFEVPAESLSKDLQEVRATFAVNFRLDPEQIVDIRRRQGTLDKIVQKIIAPQTQESFKIAAALMTAQEVIEKRQILKDTFDEYLGDRLEQYGIIVLDTSVVDLKFSEQFAQAVEKKQIAEQEALMAAYKVDEAEKLAEAEVNRAKGKAEAQKVLAETLKAQGGRLVLEKEAIAAWREGGSQVPKVLVIQGDSATNLPFLFNFDDMT